MGRTMMAKSHYKLNFQTQSSQKRLNIKRKEQNGSPTTKSYMTMTQNTLLNNKKHKKRDRMKSTVHKMYIDIYI